MVSCVSVAIALRVRAAPSRLLAPPYDPQAIVASLARAGFGWLFSAVVRSFILSLDGKQEPRA